ncbi:hypothetical protein [Rhizobium mongolense]|uniref:PilJ/NarX-like methyl-accepting chemotaxis transducer n=2 Tax=Rhizobium mongolense TaxID=57676 RepID=A0ABR6IN77_9HYPH|nr:hypothetical protein [Rhizobium mongolense]MBB4229332.1 hypothetical protein [Rhizobium mongolense]TVZ63122.1 hypothetical protein BCL32_3243 [Rhizobium mongolense USDA 1844]
MGLLGRAALRGMVILCLVVSGCANRGHVEFQAYSTAFDLQYQQADKILERLAIAERRNYKIAYPNDPLKFDYSRAAYYLDTVEPPLTASLRKSLLTIQAYNAALLSLANGESADAYVAKVAAAISDATAAVAASQIAFKGPGQTKAAEALVASVGNQLAFAVPGLRTAANLRGQQAFRMLLQETHPYMEKALATLIKGTPTFYEVLAFAKGKTSGRPGDPYTSDDIKALENEQAELAGWVLTLEATRKALNAAANAAASRADINITVLAASASDMKVLAEQLKAARLSRGAKQ